MNKRAVALLSGGLDSTLAAELILKQGIEVYGLNFTSPFCTCTSKKKEGSCSEALQTAAKLKIPIKIMQKGLDYLEIIKKPKFGYGRAMNPCIDCRIYILKKAKEYMKEIGASFVITGEVVGQRPKSQKLKFLKTIEKESNLEGLILRPLSAKLLEPTLPEKMGIVNRKELCSISGRSRKEQIKLAKNFSIIEYPCASGGCRLTEKGFTVKVKDYLENEDLYSIKDLYLLRYGRHFRKSKNHKIIIGRDEQENNILKNYVTNSEILIEPQFPAPVAIITGSNNKKFIEEAILLILKYTKKDKKGIWYRIIYDEQENIIRYESKEYERNY